MGSKRRFHLLCKLLILHMLVVSCRQVSRQAVDRLGLPRPEKAISATEMIGTIRGMSLREREDYLVEQVLSGQMPSNFRNLVPVTIKGRDRSGDKHALVIWVSNDYLSVGTDSDSIRVPMSPIGAERIAHATNSLLPTRKIVNEIYRSAAIRLKPQNLPPSREMVSTEYFIHHNNLVEDALPKNRGKGTLIAGHKKDVVISSFLTSFPDRVAIYGWHRSRSKVIQPLSIVHGINYMDYSHGIRLVHRVAELDGQPVDLRTILMSDRYSFLVNDEDDKLRKVTYTDRNSNM